MAKRKRPEGWRNKRPDDSWRHAQAARGMKTVYTKKHPKEIWLPEELFAAGGKGRWIDDSMGAIPVHNIIDLKRGIEVVESFGHKGAVKLYGETPKFGLTGHVFQYGKAEGFDPTPEDVAEKWGGGVVLSHRPLSTHVGPNVGYHVHPDYDLPGSPFDTEMEARAAADRAAAEFLRGRSFQQAVEDEPGIRQRQDEKWRKKWAEQDRQREFKRMLEGLDK